MDADGLPIVGTGIDFTKVGAIHQKRTLAFLNHFISHTVRFLNRFSSVCEEKLETLAIRLQRLETTMSILEAKLASVPGLENVTAPAASAPAATSQTSSETTNAQPTAAAAAAVPPTEQAPSTSTTQDTEPPPAPPPTEEAPKMTVSQDPRYARYFKLLHVGVPPPAVKIKMTNDGINPDLLDTPDAPAPPGDQSASNNNDEAEFSSEEEEEAVDDSSDDDDSSGFSD